MIYAVYQIQLTDAEVDLINEKGHNAVAKHVAKLDMDMDFSGNKIGDLAADALKSGYYTHVANIEAQSLEEVFQIGNIGPEENIKRLTRMSSLSVGNIIVDPEGAHHVVAAFGFKPLTSINQVAA